MRIEWVTAGIAALTCVATLAAGIGVLATHVIPFFENRRLRSLFRDHVGRGLYDASTIEASTRWYIRPKCSNLDPSHEVEIRHALDATREDLFAKVDYFLSDTCPHRHLLILGDSGTGKTSFLLNYYAYRRRDIRRGRCRIALVPLGAANSLDLIDAVPEKEDTAVFLDALDEDTSAISNHHERLRVLMDACKKFRRVILTCRTQFFPSDEEIPVDTGIIKIGALKAGEKKAYEFRKLYISPFADSDVQKYIRLRYPFWRPRSRKIAREYAHRIPHLTARPMLLAYLPDVIASGAAIASTPELYEVMVGAWLERETAWARKEALREFSERLAVHLYVTRRRRGAERIPEGDLLALADAWQVKLHAWQMSGRSLLNRDAQGNLKFAHRSIMEYLFVCRLAQGDPECRNVLLSDQMKAFIVELYASGSDRHSVETLCRLNVVSRGLPYRHSLLLANPPAIQATKSAAKTYASVLPELWGTFSGQLKCSTADLEQPPRGLTGAILRLPPAYSSVGEVPDLASGDSYSIAIMGAQVQLILDFGPFQGNPRFSALPSNRPHALADVSGIQVTERAMIYTRDILEAIVWLLRHSIASPPAPFSQLLALVDTYGYTLSCDILWLNAQSEIHLLPLGLRARRFELVVSSERDESTVWPAASG